jgi:FkbM family methyltransferase
VRKCDLVFSLQKAGLYNALDGLRDWVQFAQVRNRSSFSQFGEDLFLANYFRGRSGFYIDVGGNHPFRISNTYLLYRMGWRGVVVEPIRRMYNKHRRFRPRDIQINSAAGSVEGKLIFREMIPAVLSTCDKQESEELICNGSARLWSEYTVPVLTVSELYRVHLAPNPVSLLSVDTEGFDLNVLRGVDWDCIRPEVIVCEANNAESSTETMRFLAERDYEPIITLGCNKIFVRR